jgi:hypothetical protein
MKGLRVDPRDVIGGAALVLLGIGAMVIASSYPFGTARRMGPGYFPMVLGGILCALGAAVIVKGFMPRLWDQGVPRPPSLRAIAWVSAGVIAFVLTGDRLGFIPATVLLIVISALADRGNSLRTVLLLALAVATVGVGFFWYVLDIRFDLIAGLR